MPPNRDDEKPQTSKRGFASMDPQRQREIASQGGKAAHQQGKAHQFTSREAQIAGSKGGTIAHQRGTAHEFTSAEAREAGRAGGQASRNRQRAVPARDEQAAVTEQQE